VKSASSDSPDEIDELISPHYPAAVGPECSGLLAASARRAGGTVTRTPSNSSRLTPRAVSSSRSHSDRPQFLTGEPDDNLPTPRLRRPRPTLPHSPRPFLRGELHKAHSTHHGLSNRGRANAADASTDYGDRSQAVLISVAMWFDRIGASLIDHERPAGGLV
jgi:hypothetical protein